MKRGIIIVICAVLLLAAYGVYARYVQAESRKVDDGIASEIYTLLIDNGYDVDMEEGRFAGFNDRKSLSIWSTADIGDIQAHELISHPEIFSVDISLYSTENDAIIKTGQFSPKGDVYLGDNGRYLNLGYFQPVHYYRAGNAIIRYLGVDPAVRELLEAHCGKQFAGD